MKIIAVKPIFEKANDRVLFFKEDSLVLIVKSPTANHMYLYFTLGSGLVEISATYQDHTACQAAFEALNSGSKADIFDAFRVTINFDASLAQFDMKHTVKNDE
jgi:hypothetical protein